MRRARVGTRLGLSWPVKMHPVGEWAPRTPKCLPHVPKHLLVTALFSFRFRLDLNGALGPVPNLLCGHPDVRVPGHRVLDGLQRLGWGEELALGVLLCGGATAGGPASAASRGGTLAMPTHTRTAHPVCIPVPTSDPAASTCPSMEVPEVILMFVCTNAAVRVGG